MGKKRVRKMKLMKMFHNVKKAKVLEKKVKLS